MMKVAFSGRLGSRHFFQNSVCGYWCLACSKAMNDSWKPVSNTLRHQPVSGERCRSLSRLGRFKGQVAILPKLFPSAEPNSSTPKPLKPLNPEPSTPKPLKP